MRVTVCVCALGKEKHFYKRGFFFWSSYITHTYLCIPVHVKQDIHTADMCVSLVGPCVHSGGLGGSVWSDPHVLRFRNERGFFYEDCAFLARVYFINTVYRERGGKNTVYKHYGGNKRLVRMCVCVRVCVQGIWWRRAAGCTVYRGSRC